MTISEKAIQDKIKWHPHPAQQEILKADGRQVVICAGRRFGKSALCAYVILLTLAKNALELKQGKDVKPCKIWIVSPTYDLSGKVFEYLARWFVTIFPDWASNVSGRIPQSIRTPLGQKIECKSADTPTSLLGEELDLLVIDECSRIKKDVYQTYLYPTTVSRQATTFFISTPFGKNWFWEEHKKAGESAFHFKSTDNPYFPEKELEIARQTLPTDVFEQEFLAAFREGEGMVFRGVRQCINQSLTGNDKPKVGHKYIMGLDVAKIRDFTVITIIDKKTHEVVFHDRFNKIPYTLQKERIVKAAKTYGAKIVIDSLNVGAALADDLRAGGMRVQEFKSAGHISKDWQKKGTKERIVEKLVMMIEERNVHLPPEPVLIDELEAYSYQLTQSGAGFKYAAPSGLHDDCVDSLALAVWTLLGKAKGDSIMAKQSIPPKKRIFEYN